MAAEKPQVCSCAGWWEQVWFGRQSMEDLTITFSEQELQGSGTDIIGPFVLSGIFRSDGTVVIQKQYLGRHSVRYLGIYDGEGSITGEWNLAGMSGPWMITIRRAESGAEQEIVELTPQGRGDAPADFA